MALLAVSGAWARGGDTLPAARLNSAQIVAEMQIRNQMRSRELRDYQSLRHYVVEYHGYGAKISARMAVEVTYNSASGKSFRIVSQSGSPFLCDKVLKRAVDSEEEASRDKESTALTTANYRFQLDSVESLNGRPAYVLDVDPVKPAKFLYRGKIWVDAADFAVVKIDATPAKNPSIWISKTTIRHTSAMTDGFWLPEETRSQTWVRIGGTAVLTIDYGAYHVAAQPAASLAGGGQ